MHSMERERARRASSRRNGVINLFLAGTACAMVAGCAASSKLPESTRPAPQTGRPVTVATEPWTFNGRPGRLLSTDNYQIYTTEQDALLTNRIPLFMERALDEYRTRFGPLPDPPKNLDTFLMGNRREFVSITRKLTGDRADVYLKIQRGGYAFNGNAVLFDIGPHDTMSIASHEGWHQYTQRTFREPLPTWLEEGVATYFEGHRWRRASPDFSGWANVERFDQLRAAAAAGKLLPLEEVITSAPAQLLDRQVTSQDLTLTWYAQIWALVHFLREGNDGMYREQLERLIADAANGRLYATLSAVLGERAARASMMQRRGPAFVSVYFDRDLARISAAYERFMIDLVSPGTRGDIVSGASPFAAD